MNQEANLIVKICKNLPLDLTLFAKNGRCQKIDDYCPYQLRLNHTDLIICRKKTSTTVFLQNNPA